MALTAYLLRPTLTIPYSHRHTDNDAFEVVHNLQSGRHRMQPSPINTSSRSRLPPDPSQWTDRDLTSYVRRHYSQDLATTLSKFIQDFRITPPVLWYLQTDAEELARLTYEDKPTQHLVLDLAHHVRPTVSPTTPRRKHARQLSMELDVTPPEPAPSPPPEEPEVEDEVDVAESVSDWALDEIPEEEFEYAHEGGAHVHVHDHEHTAHQGGLGLDTTGGQDVQQPAVAEPADDLVTLEDAEELGPAQGGDGGETAEDDAALPPPEDAAEHETGETGSAAPEQHQPVQVQNFGEDIHADTADETAQGDGATYAFADVERAADEEHHAPANTLGNAASEDPEDGATRTPGEPPVWSGGETGVAQGEAHDPPQQSPPDSGEVVAEDEARDEAADQGQEHGTPGGEEPISPQSDEPDQANAEHGAPQERPTEDGRNPLAIPTTPEDGSSPPETSSSGQGDEETRPPSSWDVEQGSGDGETLQNRNQTTHGAGDERLDQQLGEPPAVADTESSQQAQRAQMTEDASFSANTTRIEPTANEQVEGVSAEDLRTHAVSDEEGTSSADPASSSARPGPPGTGSDTVVADPSALPSSSTSPAPTSSPDEDDKSHSRATAQDAENSDKSRTPPVQSFEQSHTTTPGDRSSPPGEQSKASMSETRRAFSTPQSTASDRTLSISTAPAASSSFFSFGSGLGSAVGRLSPWNSMGGTSFGVRSAAPSSPTVTVMPRTSTTSVSSGGSRLQGAGGSGRLLVKPQAPAPVSEDRDVQEQDKRQTASAPDPASAVAQDVAEAMGSSCVSASSASPADAWKSEPDTTFEIPPAATGAPEADFPSADCAEDADTGGQGETGRHASDLEDDGELIEHADADAEGVRSGGSKLSGGRWGLLSTGADDDDAEEEAEKAVEGASPAQVAGSEAGAEEDGNNEGSEDGNGEGSDAEGTGNGGSQTAPGSGTNKKKRKKSGNGGNKGKSKGKSKKRGR